MFHNVAAVSVQILANLGYRRLLLLGIDGVYHAQPAARALDRPYHLQAIYDNDPNHFCANYHGVSRRYTRPNPTKFMRGWHMLADALSVFGIEVMNATLGSAVKCFPRVDLEMGLRWLDGESRS